MFYFLILCVIVTLSQAMNLPNGLHLHLLASYIKDFTVDSTGNIFYTMFNDCDVYYKPHETNKLKQIICLPEVTCLSINETHLFLGYNDGYLIVLDKNTGTNCHTIALSDFPLQRIQYNKDFFLIQDSNNTIYKLSQDRNYKKLGEKKYSKKTSYKISNQWGVIYHKDYPEVILENLYIKDSKHPYIVEKCKDCALTDTCLCILSKNELLYCPLPPFLESKKISLEERNFRKIEMVNNHVYIL